MATYNIGGKRISIHSNGKIFINGSDTGIKKWNSENNRYSNNYGRELKELRGLCIEEALRLKGFIS